MKKIISIIAIALLFNACDINEDTTTLNIGTVSRINPPKEKQGIFKNFNNIDSSLIITNNDIILYGVSFNQIYKDYRLTEYIRGRAYNIETDKISNTLKKYSEGYQFNWLTDSTMNVYSNHLERNEIFTLVK